MNTPSTATADNTPFEEDPPRVPDEVGRDATDALLLDIDGYEGPLDVLLELAQSQKVDLAKISVLQLARQYLAFVDRAKELNLDLAAEYLVMAAWLTYLKSRLILPKDEEEEAKHSAEAMAEALQFQLARLEAMRTASEKLTARPQLGQNVFKRGMAEGLRVKSSTQWDVQLFDVLKAYGDIQRRNTRSTVSLPKFSLLSAEGAMEKLTKMLGRLPRKGMKTVWTTLRSFVGEEVKDPLFARSSLASMLTVGLEMAKQGRLEIRQDGLFKPVYMREILNVESSSQTVSASPDVAEEQ